MASMPGGWNLEDSGELVICFKEDYVYLDVL